MARVTSPAGPYSHVSHGARAISWEMLTGPRGRDLHDLLTVCTDSESTVHVADEVGMPALGLSTGHDGTPWTRYDRAGKHSDHSFQI